MNLVDDYYDNINNKIIRKQVVFYQQTKWELAGWTKSKVEFRIVKTLKS